MMFLWCLWTLHKLDIGALTKLKKVSDGQSILLGQIKNFTQS